MIDLQDLRRMCETRPDTFDFKASGILKLINEIERLRDLLTRERAAHALSRPSTEIPQPPSCALAPDALSQPAISKAQTEPCTRCDGFGIVRGGYEIKEMCDCENGMRFVSKAAR